MFIPSGFMGDVRYYTSKDEKRPGRWLSFLFITSTDSRCTNGVTIKEAYDKAKQLMGEKPTSYKFLCFTHPKRREEESNG